MIRDWLSRLFRENLTGCAALGSGCTELRARGSSLSEQVMWFESSRREEQQKVLGLFWRQKQ